ncbi:MAG TPA: hypothetical protein VH309_13660, partial [Elusimicrobiota bacterium]|nr:hypothetical protein [Elusimicrobiota bacterium]
MAELFKKLALVGDSAVLWILLAASVASLAVVIDRWRVFHKNRVNFPSFLDALGRRLEQGDAIGARKLARETGGVEGRVAAAGLAHFAKGPASAEE